MIIKNQASTSINVKEHIIEIKINIINIVVFKDISRNFTKPK